MEERSDPTPVRQLFAAALAHARVQAGCADVKALAKASRVVGPRVADFEAARAEPTLDELYGLVNTTDLSLDRLFGLVRLPVEDEAASVLHEPGASARRTRASAAEAPY